MNHYINLKNKSGQSVFEYVLVFTAVIATIIALTGNGGALRNVFQSVYQGSTQYSSLKVIASAPASAPVVSVDTVSTTSSDDTEVIAPVSTGPSALTNLFSLFNNDDHDANGKD